MANPFQDHTEHSAAFFGDTRDHWWNLDFLELMAKRLRLDRVGDVLDVGCGVGHWGQLLSAVLPPMARVVGVDREETWVRVAEERAHARGLGERFSYVHATAERLPFPDDSFDLTTCQTVLIHLRDPAAGLAEMIRVTRPSGVVMVAEPNNLTQALLRDSVTAAWPVDRALEAVRFQMICERGKIALGEGDNSLGDRVPGLFTAAGLVEVQAAQNDKVIVLAPPYTSEAARASIDEEREMLGRGEWGWGAEETRRLFLAGGGDPATFAAGYARMLEARREMINQVDQGRYDAVIAGSFFLVAGRKRTGSTLTRQS